MRRSWFIAGALLLVAVVAGRLASRRGAFSWEQMLERMPESAPPKWMFSNIQVIRENTEEILQRLEGATGSGST